MGTITVGGEPPPQSIWGQTVARFSWYATIMSHASQNTGHITLPSNSTHCWIKKALRVLPRSYQRNFDCSLTYLVCKPRVPIRRSLSVLWHRCLLRVSTHRSPYWAHFIYLPFSTSAHYKDSYLPRPSWILYHFLKNLKYYSNYFHLSHFLLATKIYSQLWLIFPYHHSIIITLRSPTGPCTTHM